MASQTPETAKAANENALVLALMYRNLEELPTISVTISRPIAEDRPGVAVDGEALRLDEDAL
jgi:hypothetical protein